MNLPFTQAQFFEVFARYNAEVFPLQIALVAAAAGIWLAFGVPRRARLA